MAMRKKGFFFIIDALLATAVLFGGLMILSNFYINEQPTVLVNYISEDILKAFSTLRIYELNNTYVNELIANGTIVNLNNSILDQIGEFWAADNIMLANAFAKNISEELLPPQYGVGIWVSDELIYQRDYPPPSSRSSARKIISGIEKNRPTKGFIANAYANSFSKTSTMIIPFYSEGAGWKGATAEQNVAELEIDKFFELNEIMNITNITDYISVHIQSTGPDYEITNINDGACIIMKDDLNFLGGDGTFDIKNINGCLNYGLNHIKVTLKNLGDNAHIHPGNLIKIDYIKEGSLENESYSNHFSKRYYFDNVISKEGSNELSGVWQIVPFHIPPDSTNVSVNMQIYGKNIIDYTGNDKFVSWDGTKKQSKDYDYIMFVNGNSPFDYKSNPSSNPIYKYNNSQLASKIVPGTNVIITYFDNYGDYVWGEGVTQIYSDPINNPENSSYVEVNYTLTSEEVPYGNIKITKSKDFGGSPNYIKTANFSFPEGAELMGDVFVHLVEQYAQMVNVKADINTPPQYTVFTSPSAKAIPTSIFIPRNRLSLSPAANNYIRVEEANTKFYFLPNTTIEYSFFVPGLIGYGSVFDSQSEADQDALDRLEQVLGDFVSSDNITIGSGNMTNVPSLWGPAIVEVRAWY